MPQKQKPTAGHRTAKAVAEQKPRQRKLNKRQKKLVIKSKKIPGIFRLLLTSVQHLWMHKKPYAMLLFYYWVSYMVLVQGILNGARLDDSRALLTEAAGGTLSAFDRTAVLFGILAGGADGTLSAEGSVYQIILFVIFTLACIWLTRRTYEGTSEVTAKNALYKGMQQLIPYVIIGFIVMIQIIPLVFLLNLYSIAASNGFIATGIETFAWLSIIGVAVAASLYFLTRTLIASYIVTLEGMTPARALRAAKEVVRSRRWLVMSRMLSFGIVLSVLLAIVLLPILLYVTVLAEIVFSLISLLAVFIIHTYFYVLYRELVK